MNMEGTDSKSKELTVIKGQMVDVISNLQLKYHLEEIMPLLNLLKTLELYINTINTGECRNWNTANINNMKLKLGPETIGITQKISFLFNRIHIESAYLASINKSVAYGIKKYYKRKEINQFVQQKTYALEKKKLFILSLKLILRDNGSINTTGLNLDFLTTMLLENIDSGIGSLMKIINKNCTICTQDPEGPTVTKSDQFCFCKVAMTGPPVTERYTGYLRFNLHAFTGIYEADYLDKMLKENAPRLVTNQFNTDMTSKHRRRCVVIVKDKYAYSNWSCTSLAINDEMAVTKAKDMEIQVWEAPSKQGGHDRIIAVAIVSLQSLLTSGKDSVTISLEPDGVVMCEVKFDSVNKANSSESNISDVNKENKPISADVYKKFGLKRRVNIFTKLGGYRLARHIEANVPVSVWTDWFQNHIDRLAVPIETDHKRNPTDSDKSVLGLHKNKVIITPCKTPLGKKTAKESYRPLCQSPFLSVNPRVTPKSTHVNGRPVCKFILKETTSERHDKPHNLSLASSFTSVVSTVPMSTPLTKKSRPKENKQVDCTNSTFERSKVGLDFNFASPIPSGVKFNLTRDAIKYYNIRKTPALRRSSLLILACSDNGSRSHQNSVTHGNRNMTRSNIDLFRDPERRASSSSSRCRRAESLVSKFKDEDEDVDDDNSAFQAFRESNKCSQSVLASPMCSMTETRDLVPCTCSPELQNIRICKIDSTRKPCDSSMKISSFVDEPDAVSVTRDWDSSFYNSTVQTDTDASLGVSVSFSRQNMDGGTAGELPSEQSLLDDSNSEVWLNQGDRYPQKPLSFGDLELLCVLGQGHFGKVVLARERNFNALCAIKSIQKSRASTEGEYDSLVSERRILLMLKEYHHPFLVGLIGCFQTEHYLLFAMEYASGGDLMGHIHKAPFSEPDASFYSACIVMAFEFLHSKNIIYRDLKLDNVLMDAQGYAKLTDFGLSKENMKWNDVTYTFCGTPEFLAPEIISLQEYTRAIDWWALGVLIYEMIVGESPFPGDEDDEIFNNILHTVPEVKNLSTDAFGMLKRLLKQKPEKRLGYGEYGAEKVKVQPFYRKIDWNALYHRKLKSPFTPKLDFQADTQYFEAEFTSRPLSIEHDDPGDMGNINDDLFIDFDTVQDWGHLESSAAN